MTSNEMGVRAKLALARLMFLNANVGKSGKNMHLEFKYFELSDIVPVATEIFDKVGLVTVTNFSDGKATMTVYDTERYSEGIEFSIPFIEIPALTDNKVTDLAKAAQALGSEITYLRRYLYLMALDIVEHDDIEPSLDDSDEPKEAPKKEKKSAKKKAPATPKEREEIKKELTEEDGDASDEDVTALKIVMRTLLEKDASQEDFVQTIVLKTDGLTKLKKSVCQELIKNIEEMIAQY